MAANAFRHVLSRWTVTSAMSKAAAALPKAHRSLVRSSRRSYFGDAARAEAKKRLDYTSYMKFLEQEQASVDRSIFRLTSGMVVAGVGLFFARIYVSLPPSTHSTTTSSVP